MVPGLTNRNRGARASATPTRNFFGRLTGVDAANGKVEITQADGTVHQVGVSERELKQHNDAADYAAKRFSATRDIQNVAGVLAEKPWVRVSDFGDQGFARNINKVLCKYKAHVSPELSEAEKIPLREKLQSSREVISGMGKVKLFENRDGVQRFVLQVIPEGHGPAEAKVGQDVYALAKATYRAAFRSDGEITLTLTQAGGPDGEIGLRPPLVTHENQPADGRFERKRPMNPDEFDKALDQMAANEIEGGRLGEALRKAAEIGGDWKAVPVQQFRISRSLTHIYRPEGTAADHVDKRLGMALDNDLALARQMIGSESKTLDMGWARPADDFTIAAMSIAGRGGMMHDAPDIGVERFMPITAIVEQSTFFKGLAEVQDLTVETNPCYAIEAVEFNTDDLSGWDAGKTVKCERDLLALGSWAQRRDARSSADAGAGQSGAAAGDNPGNQAEEVEEEAEDEFDEVPF